MTPQPADVLERLNPRTLVILKQQLRETLRRVELAERMQEKRLQPRDLSEVELLQEKLKEALESLDEKHKELEGKSRSSKRSKKKGKRESKRENGQ